MKKIILTLLITCVSFLGFAQNAAYEKGMKKGLDMLATAKTPAEYVEAANHFERISTVETKEWLPIYWTAYCTLIAGIMEEGNSKKDDYYDKVSDLLDKTESMSPDKSEVLTVRAYALLMGIAVNPMVRGPKNGPKGASMLDEAISLNPENPRPYFVKGQNTYYTPKFYGGGAERALPILETAKGKYDAESKENTLMPHWGKSRCEMLIEECKKK